MTDESLKSALRLKLDAGSFLFREGDRSTDFYIVQSGKVRVFKTEAGIEIDLDETGAGGVVGEVAAIDNGSRSASCVAVEASEVLVVPTGKFKAILETIPDWFRKIATILVQRLREADKKIHRTMSGDITPQVAAVLDLMISAGFSEASPEGPAIPQKTVENELVDLLQINISDVAKALDRLSGLGIILTGKGKIIIKNQTKLADIAAPVFSEAVSAEAT